MSNFINIIKTIWKSDRYRSLAILGIYFIFFTIIIVIAKTSTPNKQIYINPMDNFKNKDEYSFEIKIDNDVINGEYSYSYIKFNYNNILYEYSNDILIPDNFKYAEILKYINTKNIYDLVSDKDIYSKTEYNDGDISSTYKVDDTYITLYENNEIYKIEVKINNNIYEITYK